MSLLDELMNDPGKAPDDLELEIPNVGKVKLGEFRAYRKSLAEKESTVKQRLDALESERQRIVELASQASRLNEDLERAKSAQAAVPVPQTEETDFESDPLFGTLVKKKLSPMERRLESIAQSIDALTKNYQESAKFVLRDYYSRRWSTIPEAQRPKDRNWTSYLRSAQERSLLNEDGLPDPVLAWRAEMAPQLEEQTRKAAYDEGYKKAQEEARIEARHIPRPGAMQVPRKPEAKQTFKDFDEMMEAAFSDPEILKVAEGQTSA